MKKVILSGIKKFEVIEAAKPQIVNNDDVLLKIDSVGVCGSDIHYYNEGKIGDQIIDFPFTIGHECSAVVEKVGKNVTRIKPGDLVAVSRFSVTNVSVYPEENIPSQSKFLGCQDK
jgi:L-iditol 2-dehydrogenase